MKNFHEKGIIMSYSKKQIKVANRGRKAESQRRRKRLEKNAPNLLAVLENCTIYINSILAQALLGNYEDVKVMLKEFCSIQAQAIEKAIEKAKP